jgi:type II secretory pathway predicted ATPase ExeA
VGQPELKRVLQLQVYEAIAQRVNFRYHLPPMDRQESKEYVYHHLKVAGITSSIFTDDALDVIYNIPEALQER